SETSTAAPAADARTSFAAPSPFSTLRHPSTTLAPAPASSRAATRPIPLFAPVTITLRPAWLGICSTPHFVLIGPPLASFNRLTPSEASDSMATSLRGREAVTDPLMAATYPADHSSVESLPEARPSNLPATVLMRPSVFLGLIVVRLVFGYLRGFSDNAGFPHERTVLPA